MMKLIFRPLLIVCFVTSLLLTTACTDGIESDSRAIRKELEELNKTVELLTEFIGQLAQVGLTLTGLVQNVFANYDPGAVADEEDFDMDSAFDPPQGQAPRIDFEPPPPAPAAELSSTESELEGQL